MSEELAASCLEVSFVEGWIESHPLSIHGQPPSREVLNRLQTDPRPERHVSLASTTFALVKKNELLQIIGVEGKGRYRI